MNSGPSKLRVVGCRHLVWLVIASLAFPAGAPAQTPPPQSTQAAAPAGATFKQEELDAMLAPIALYPDALLSQVLMASTYPLEVVEAARWSKEHSNLKGQALDDALQSQSWDASVKSLTAFPEVLDRMNKDLTWTQRMGDAFLAQQQQVMDTVQSLRQKAQAQGNLKSNQQQTVETQNVDNKQYIVIQPANPEVIYVPTYQPTVVYGAWPYPAYPPYYPPYWGVGAAFVSGFAWGVGIAAGAALWGGFNWRGGDVNINVNRYNNFNRTNISNGNWQHNVNHRGGVPYRDNASRQKYGNYDRQAAQARDQFRGRDSGLGAQGLNDKSGLREAQNRGVGSSNNLGNRPGAGTADRGGAAANRDYGGRPGGAQAGGGNRQFDSGNRGAFSSGSAAQTRADSSRGNASLGAARGGGGGGAARAGGGGGARGGGGGGGRGGGGRR
jgi:hypothetical protein